YHDGLPTILRRCPSYGCNVKEKAEQPVKEFSLPQRHSPKTLTSLVFESVSSQNRCQQLLAMHPCFTIMLSLLFVLLYLVSQIPFGIPKFKTVIIEETRRILNLDCVARCHKNKETSPRACSYEPLSMEQSRCVRVISRTLLIELTLLNCGGTNRAKIMAELSIPGDTLTKKASTVKNRKHVSQADLLATAKEKKRRQGENLFRTRREEALKDAEVKSEPLGQKYINERREMKQVKEKTWGHRWGMMESTQKANAPYFPGRGVFDNHPLVLGYTYKHKFSVLPNSELRKFTKFNKIDVLTVSETWLNTSVTNKEIEIEGYKLHRLDRLHKKGGGTNFHQLWIKLQHKKSKSLLLIKSPTRITESSQTLVDVIFVSSPRLVVNSGVIETCISDHFPVMDNVDEKLTIFNEIFLNTLDKHAPVKTIKR
ncbi:Hypothetical predicted protein, partial [Paramuricea clavata]